MQGVAAEHIKDVCVELLFVVMTDALCECVRGAALCVERDACAWCGGGECVDEVPRTHDAVLEDGCVYFERGEEGCELIEPLCGDVVFCVCVFGVCVFIVCEVFYGLGVLLHCVDLFIGWWM